ncbi:MAG: efflux RND transporter periplasmic adaptor subunit [Chitinophagaceae bacterium]
MKKKKKYIIWTIIVVVLAVLAYFLFFRKEEKQISLITETATQGYISETVSSTGTIEPVDTVAVGTQVSGTINKIYADYNSTVKNGELLATLDPTLMQANVDEIKGNLAEAQSTLVYQDGNFNRQKQLYQVGAISKADYDNALSTYQAAKASVAAIKAELVSANKNLDYTKIYAPTDGVVLSRSVSVGQTVAASFSTPTLFTIAKDIKDMQVQAKIDEADIGNIKQGQKVTFTVDAYINDIFKGSVNEVRLEPTTSSNVVTYTTIINAPNDDIKLKPGMTATVTIYTSEDSNALILPVKALKYAPEDSAALRPRFQIIHATKSQNELPDIAYVWVVKGNQIIETKVKTGLNDNTHVQILEGINAGDKILTGTTTVAVAAGSEDASNPFMPKFPKRKK